MALFVPKPISYSFPGIFRGLRVANFYVHRTLSFRRLLSSQNGEKREALHVSNVDCGHEAMEAIRGSGLDEAYHARCVSSLSPRKTDNRTRVYYCFYSNTTNQTQYTQHFPEAAKPNDAESNGHVYPSGADSKAQALRHSQKRSLSSDSQNIEANDLHYTGEGAQVRKKVRLSREDAGAAGLEVPSKPYRSDKPRNIIPGRGDRIKGEATRGLLGNKKAKPVNTCAAPHGAGTNSSRKTANGSSGVGPAKTSCTLTVPVAPAFTTDVLHHKRIHVRSEREARQQAISVGVRTNRLQSDDRSAGNCAKVKVITSDTQVSCNFYVCARFSPIYLTVDPNLGSFTRHVNPGSLLSHMRFGSRQIPGWQIGDKSLKQNSSSGNNGRLEVGTRTSKVRLRKNLLISRDLMYLKGV